MLRETQRNNNTMTRFGFVVLSLAFGQPIELSLLQRKVSRHHFDERKLQISTSSVSQGDPDLDVRERKQCPHEIEQAKPEQNKGGQPFGCRCTKRVGNTKMCAFWGDPRVTSTFPSQHPIGRFS